MPSSKFRQLLRKYQTALEILQRIQPLPSVKQVLDVLRTRDQLRLSLDNKTDDPPQEISELINLDEQLRKLDEKINKAIDLKRWRNSILPSESDWWWFLDEQIYKSKKQTEIILNILTGTLMIFAISIAIEIIQRLWTNSSDTISIVATLFTVLLTASPFVKQGHEIFEWLLGRLTFIKPKNISGVRIATAGLSLIILLALRLWILPGPLAAYYNNYGAKARETGNIDLAQRLFKRAAALNPDRVVPYQNIADSYNDIGLEDQSIEWYQKAVEHDANFAPAYRGLGESYNRRGNYSQAESVLLAGLSQKSGYADETVEKVTKYELMSNLGWSYWGENKTDLAHSTLENALNMEADLKKIGDLQGVEYRLALPHFYLALIYEQAGDIENAKQQWEDCLRFLDAENLYQRERALIAQKHLQEIENK